MKKSVFLLFFCLIVFLMSCVFGEPVKGKDLSKETCREGVLLLGKKNDPKSFEIAREKFIEAINLDENNDEAHSYLGYIYCKQENYSKAIEEFSIAKKINSTRAYYYYMLGVLKETEGDYRGAVDELASALLIGFEKDEKKDLLPAANYYLGIAYQRTGDAENAEKYYKQACSLNPEKIEYQLSLAEVLLYREKYSEAKKIYENIKKKLPPSSKKFIEANSKINEIVKKEKKEIFILVLSLIVISTVLVVLSLVLSNIILKRRVLGEEVLKLEKALKTEEKIAKFPQKTEKELEFSEMIETIDIIKTLDAEKEEEFIFKEDEEEKIKIEEITEKPKEETLIEKTSQRNLFARREELLTSTNIYAETGFYKTTILFDVLDIETRLAAIKNYPLALAVFRIEGLGEIIRSLVIEKRKMIIKEVYDIIKTFVRVDLDVTFSMDMENFCIIINQADREVVKDILSRYEKAVNGITVGDRNLKLIYNSAIFPHESKDINELVKLARANIS